MRGRQFPVWLVAAALLLAPPPAHAQDAAGWDSPRVLELLEAARLRRQLPRGDSALRNYQARANGYVYFYLDRTSPLWSEFSQATAIGMHFAGDWPELQMEFWAVREERR